MWAVDFWKDVAERAIKTFAQALISVLTVGTPIMQLDWVDGLGIGATAAVVSVFTSIASSGLGEKGSASLLSSGEVD